MNRYKTTTRGDIVGASTSAGFTLLELLISMTVLSLLATTILFGWRIATSAWQKANTYLAASRLVTETNHLLEEQIASMLPYQARTDIGNIVFFQGEPKTARFVSRYSLEGRSSSGLYEIEYQLEEENDRSCHLLLNESPVTSMDQLGLVVRGNESTPTGGTVRRFAPFEKNARTITLLQGTSECRFEYYQPATPGTKGVWTEQWPAVEFLPTAMAIRLAESSQSNKLKPVTLVAAIRNNSKPTP
jgi:prepilin-type N-terminal cleavage/methylation domain-containing protein